MKDGVVAEATGAGWCLQNRSVGARADDGFGASSADECDYADEVSGAFVAAFAAHLVQQFFVALYARCVRSRVACGFHAGRAIERGNDEARVVRENVGICFEFSALCCPELRIMQ